VAAGLGPLEFFGDLCLLKAGMLLAHKVTTVSRTYAAEIIAGKHGNGLDTVARSRADGITGIVNGVDYGTWDPRNDPLLPAHYHPDDLAGKAACKTALRARFDLESLPDRPIFVIVSRLNRQKGLDLAADAADAIVESGGQLIVIGSGENQLEWRFQMLRDRHPRHIGVYLGYSDPLAHLAIAGGDVLLMPSRHEPCGLTQLYALRYGTLPLVRATGGLVDTVIDTTPDTLQSGMANGFVFDTYDSQALERAVWRALDAHADRDLWSGLVRRAMLQDWSWDSSGREYLRVYEQALART
jgi:starch synthase